MREAEPVWELAFQRGLWRLVSFMSLTPQLTTSDLWTLLRAVLPK